MERAQREKRLVQEAKDAAEREWRSKLALLEEQADAARADAAAAAALAAAERGGFAAYGGDGGGGGGGGGSGGGDSALYAAAKMQAGQVRRPLPERWQCVRWRVWSARERTHCGSEKWRGPKRGERRLGAALTRACEQALATPDHLPDDSRVRCRTTLPILSHRVAVSLHSGNSTPPRSCVP